MPQPTLSDVHVNRPLTDISIAFMQDQSAFVADRVFPNIPVQKESDRYFVYSRDDFFRDQMQERAPSTESAGGGYNIDSTPSYSVRDWALHKDIDDRIRNNSDTPLNSDRDATEFLSLQALIRKDRIWVTNYFATSVWTGDQTGVASAPGANQFLRWDVPGSTPIEDIKAQKLAVQKLTGYIPNKLVLGPEVYNVLENHAEFMDRIKYTQRGAMTPDLMASLLGVDEVLVANGVYNTSGEVSPATMSSGTNAFIAGKSALLAYAPASPGIMKPSAGYTFSLTSGVGSGPAGSRIKKFRMDWLNSDRVEIDMMFDLKLVAVDLGRFFATTIS